MIERSKDGPLPLLLYHSELDLVEELPFNRSWLQNGWTFSPDGKWLLLSQPSSQENETDEIWIRSVDPPGSTAVQITEGGGLAGFGMTTDGDRLALIQSPFLQVNDFPRGEVLGRWRTPGYFIDRLWWSPDGNCVVVQGFQVSSNQGALFVVEP